MIWATPDVDNVMIWIYHYLLNRIRLDLDLDNSCWIQKIYFCKYNIFLYITIDCPREIELAIKQVSK